MNLYKCLHCGKYQYGTTWPTTCDICHWPLDTGRDPRTPRIAGDLESGHDVQHDLGESRRQELDDFDPAYRSLR